MCWIGIDLGTSKTVLAVQQGRKVQAIESPSGQISIPSVIGINEHGDWLFGERAEKLSLINPEQTVDRFVPFVGLRNRELNDMSILSEPIVSGDPNEFVKFSMNHQIHSANSVAQRYLDYLRSHASAKLGRDVSAAVIVVPHAFHYVQRLALREISRAAGFERVRLIDSGSAAALEYGKSHHLPKLLRNRELRGKQHGILTSDAGDFFSEASYVEVELPSEQELLDSCLVFQELCSRFTIQGSGRLLNRELSNALLLSNGILQPNRILAQASVSRRLDSLCKQLKNDLTVSNVANAEAPYLTSFKGEPVHLNAEISSDAYLDLCASNIASIKQLLTSTVKDIHECSLAEKPIDVLLPIGAASRHPSIKRLLQETCNLKPFWKLDPNVTAAFGAARLAAVLAGDNKNLLLLQSVHPPMLKSENTLSQSKWGSRDIPYSISAVATMAQSTQSRITFDLCDEGKGSRTKDVPITRLSFKLPIRVARSSNTLKMITETDQEGIITVCVEDYLGTVAKWEINRLDALAPPDIPIPPQERVQFSDKESI